ncbi:MAG: hypothetical protein ACPGGF_06775 [Flavobacteriaceae bacterium]
MRNIIIYTAMLWAIIAQAQWTSDTEVNTQVVDQTSSDMKAIGASDGSTYVVFWQSVGAPQNYELRLQVLNPMGEQMLGPEGVLVSDDLPMSTYTVLWNVVVDQEDNLYIGATGTGGGDPAFVFKMDLEGNRLWGPTGLSVGSGNVVRVLPLSQGGAVVSWWSATGVAQIQKFDNNGQAVWASSKPVVLGSSNTVIGNLFELSSGDLLVVFHQTLTGINSFLHAQRFDVNGDPVWAAPIQISNEATAFNRDYSGMLIQDKVYMGYYASAGTRFDTYLQCIESDGTLPWGINGSSFDTTQSFYEMGPHMGHKSGAEQIWMSSTYTNTSQSTKGTYLQKFDLLTGQRMLGDGAYELYSVGSEFVPVGGLNVMDQGPLLLIKRGVDNGASPTTLGATYLDENAQPVWPEGLRDVATFQANKSRIQLTEAVNNQSVSVFVEQKSGSPKIYAQNIVDGQVMGFSEHGTPISLTFISPFCQRLQVQSSDSEIEFEIFDVRGGLMLPRSSIEALESLSFETWPVGLYVLRATNSSGADRLYRLIKK